MNDVLLVEGFLVEVFLVGHQIGSRLMALDLVTTIRPESLVRDLAAAIASKALPKIDVAVVVLKCLARKNLSSPVGVVASNSLSRVDLVVTFAGSLWCE